MMLVAPSCCGKICWQMGLRVIQVLRSAQCTKPTWLSVAEVVASAVKDHWRQGGPVRAYAPFKVVGAADRCPESGRAGRA